MDHCLYAAILLVKFAIDCPSRSTYSIGAIVCSDHDKAVEGSQNAPEVGSRLIPPLRLTLQSIEAILNGVIQACSGCLASSMGQML